MENTTTLPKMTAAQRAAWMTGTRKQASAALALVTSGAVRCDTCEAPAVAMTDRGDGSAVIVECGPCFILRTREERLTRPTREQLVARVNAAARLMPARVESLRIPVACAWCRAVMPSKPGVPMLGSDGKPLVSHGVCAPCLAKLEAEAFA